MYKENRPKLKLQKTQSRKIIEIITFIAIAFCFVYPAIYYSSLPDKIPMHFNFSGNVDKYGAKNSVWFLAIIGVITCFGLYKLNHYPHLFNYPVKITEENAKKQYTDTVKMLSYVNLLIAILFAVICYQIVEIALNQGKQFDQWSEYLIYTILGLLAFGPLVLVVINIFTKEKV